MLDPESVFGAIERINDHGMQAHLQSAYLGKTREEIDQNVRRLSDLELAQFITSLSMYHEDGKPKDIAMSHNEYLVMMIDALTKRGIKVSIKNTWEPERGDESTDHSNDFAGKLLDAGAHYLGEPLDQGTKVFAMNGTQIDIIDPSIISVGKARVSGFSSQKMPDWQEELYHCPIYYEPHHGKGMLVLYPDGNVARCCSAERRADFGFGNVFESSWDDILTNMQNSEYVHPDMHTILEEGHRMLQEEFPHLLPEKGASQACEVCSPIVSNPRLRKRLAERLGQPDLFTPFTQEANSEE